MADQEVIQKASQLLDQLIVGHHVAEFSAGAVWVMRLEENDYQLACFDFSSTMETPINQALRGIAPDLFDCADPEDIAKATILSAVIRRKILSASIRKDASLAVTFEGDLEVVLLTATDVVDWQWCITENVPDPYRSDFALACFRKGEVSLLPANDC